MVVFTMYILDEALIYCLELFGMACEHVLSSWQCYLLYIQVPSSLVLVMQLWAIACGHFTE